MRYLLCASGLVFLTITARAQQVTIRTLPERVLVQKGATSQSLNFDLLVKNEGKDVVEIDSIELSVLGPNEELINQRRVDTNGDRASILTVGERKINPGATRVYFNPFQAMDPDLDLSHLRYELMFSSGAEKGRTVRTDLRPLRYDGKTDLRLPVRGRILVHDGHDLYSHHRRLDITGGMTTALGIKSNFMRYSYDFCVVDEKGKMFRGTGEKNEDWYGFGAPILAPGSGRVIATVNDIPDNTRSKKVQISRDQFMKNPRIFLGNFVVIDHENGEFSFLGHMKQGSVTVKPRQRVRQGEQIGAMGFSGDAFLVHLHYQVQSDDRFAEGLPSQFRDYRRFVGSRRPFVKKGVVNSGDVVESGVNQ